MTINHEAASSALYHVEAIERRLKLIKQYINPEKGVVNDMQVVAGLVNGIDEEISDLHIDLSKFL